MQKNLHDRLVAHPTPAARRAECMVAVPLACRMPNFRPNFAANSSSSRAASPGEPPLWNPKSNPAFRAVEKLLKRATKILTGRENAKRADDPNVTRRAPQNGACAPFLAALDATVRCSIGASRKCYLPSNLLRSALICPAQFGHSIIFLFSPPRFVATTFSVFPLAPHFSHLPMSLSPSCCDPALVQSQCDNQPSRSELQ